MFNKLLCCVVLLFTISFVFLPTVSKGFLPTQSGPSINDVDEGDLDYPLEYDSKCNFDLEHMIGNGFISKLRRFHCLCGTRLWCSNAMYLKVIVNTGLSPSIRTQIIDSKSLPAIMMWKRASNHDRKQYRDTSIIHLPWYQLAHPGNPYNNHYAIMQCTDPECPGIKRAIQSWEKELRRFSLIKSIDETDSIIHNS